MPPVVYADASCIVLGLARIGFRQRMKAKSTLLPVYSLIPLAVLSACFGSRARRFEISSVESDYSPAGRFWVHVGVRDSLVHVEIDSAIALVPGPRQTSPVPAVANVMLRALIVTSGVPKWVPLELTDAVRIADTLFWGAPHPVHRMQFDVRRPSGVALDRSWLIFEFTGRALLFSNWPRIQTFACSSVSLAGRPLAGGDSRPVTRADYMKTC
jgi:hypothetical protein